MTLPHLIVAAIAASLAVAAAPGAARTDDPPAKTVPTDDRGPTPSPTPSEATLRRFFEPLNSALTDAIERFDRDPGLPESSWNPFEETKKSNAERLNAILDECANLLADGETIDVRRRIRALESERTQLVESVRVSYEKQTAARPKSEREWYELFGKSKEDWESSIAKAEARQAAIDEEIASLRSAFAANLRRLGLEVGSDGGDSLLATVAGDRFVDMVQAFDNVRLVTEQLRHITERMKESPETAKRYYGMYVLLVRTMDRIQDAFVETIETAVLPEIERYGKEATETERQASALLKTADDASRTVLEKNIAACRLAQEAVANYRAYLAAQVSKVRDQNRSVESRLKVAENTYRTMALSVGIAELIRQGEVDLRAVMTMELPQLRGFENAALREQYQRLNERLRAK
ncbi:MAG: hypothetical protein JNM94_07295 [Phycisphaerae bacterium]|nr:hypothetical protein [Phycisphaerae bacterium]